MAGRSRAVLRASSPVEAGTATPSDDPWLRWLRTPGYLVALSDAAGTVPLLVGPAEVDRADARVLKGSAEVTRDGDRLSAPATPSADGPCLLELPRG